MNQRNSDVIKN